MTWRKALARARAGGVVVVPSVLAFAVLVLTQGQVLAFGPLGNEVQVNTYTTHYQGFGGIAVAADPTGSFVVVWDGDGDQDGSGTGVFGQRFDASGAPVGPEFQVNSYTTYDQGFGGLAVAADATGNFVVVWNEDSRDGSSWGLFGQRFDNLGNPVGSDFQVNSYTTGDQGRPGPGVAVASDASGNFVVVWGGRGPGDDQGVFARRFDNLGNPQTGDVLVNTYTTGLQGVRGGQDIAADASGNFVVVWTSIEQDGYGYGVFGQRFDDTGTPNGPEFQVNTQTAGQQGGHSLAVAAAPSGNFMVVWDGYIQDDDTDVFAQRFDAGGHRLGGEFQVNTYTFYQQGTGAYLGQHRGVGVAADDAGNFMVVWDSNPDSGNLTKFDVLAQRYDAAGHPLGGEFQVNTYTYSYQLVPAIAADSGGHFLVAWASVCDGCEDESQDGSYSGIFSQRFGEEGTSLIAGRRMAIRNPTGQEDRRTVAVAGKERASDISAIVGDPVANGATLRIIANGAIDSDETFILDGAGWKATSNGFRYRGPTGADGDAVSRVKFSRSRSGTVVLKVRLKGLVGTQSLDVVPPATGDSGGAILAINGGGTYCIALGGAAGGLEKSDTLLSWRIINATAQPGCPAP